MKNLISHFFMWRDREDAAAHTSDLRYKISNKTYSQKIPTITCSYSTIKHQTNV